MPNHHRFRSAFRSALPGPLTAVFLAASVFSGCSPEPEPLDVVEATISQVQEAILNGETTCRMVVQAHLDRIEAYDEATVNAITVVNPPLLVAKVV